MKKANKSKLKPGSSAARKAGCRCPVMDNNYGKGYMGQAGIYVMQGDCPIHGQTVSTSMAKRLATQKKDAP